MTLAQVRPGFFGWPTFWLLYAAAGNLGAMAATVVLVLPLIVLGDSPAQPVFGVVGVVLWVAAVVLAVRWAHPKIVRFIDRAHFRLTEDHLYLGRRDKLTVDLRDVTDAWFGNRTSGASATRAATRHGYRVLVLRLENGWFVPVSPRDRLHEGADRQAGTRPPGGGGDAVADARAHRPRRRQLGVRPGRTRAPEGFEDAELDLPLIAAGRAIREVL
jgi:hypothetical protein